MDKQSHFKKIRFMSESVGCLVTFAGLVMTARSEGAFGGASNSIRLQGENQIEQRRTTQQSRDTQKIKESSKTSTSQQPNRDKDYDALKELERELVLQQNISQRNINNSTKEGGVMIDK